MKEFYKKVNIRSKQAMIDFLTNHFRYDTLNSWNNSTSYANNIKIYNLGLEKETENKLYDLLNVEEFWDEINYILDDFSRKNNHLWQIGVNGRSGGYLVLYQGKVEPSGYKSYCTSCYQKNYTSITENNNICGKCHKPTRVDYNTTHMNIVTYSSKPIDMNEDFNKWTMYELKEKVKLIQSFDKATDDFIRAGVTIANSCEVIQEEYYIPQTRKVLQYIVS
jgi:hypothetical protein